MRVWLLWIAACSTPAPKHEPVKPPPDDEETSAAWQAKQPKIDAGSAWRFDWELVRRDYDKLMATQPGDLPCDWRVRPRPNVECLPRDMPRRHAAKIKQAIGIEPGVSRVEVDIGADDKVTPAWWGAVLDDAGLPTTEWVHPDPLGPHRSFLVIPKNIGAVERKTRAALVREKPES